MIPHWDWYESEFEAVYGFVPPTRHLVERYRAGDVSVVEEFHRLAVMSDADAGDFVRFEAKGNLAWVATDYAPERLGQDALGLAAGIRSDLAQQGVAYAEQRTFPTPPPALLEDFSRDSSGPTMRAAATLPRVHPMPVWEQVKEILVGPFGTGIVAVDFSGVEEGNPPQDLAPLVVDVHAFNAEHPDRAVAVLDHVGESFTDKSLESAIRWVQEAAELGVHRLGHAIALGIDPSTFGEHTRTETIRERRDQIAYDISHAARLRAQGVPLNIAALQAEDAQLAQRPRGGTVEFVYDDARLDEVRRRQEVAMARVRATGAVIEVCPTSNRRIGGITDPAHHPIHRFIAAGLPVVVCADDPGIFDITLQDELDWVTEATNQPELRDHLVETAWRSRAEVLSERTP